MKVRRKLKARNGLIFVCVGFFVLGGIVGYRAGKTSAAVKIEPTKPVQTKAEEPKQEIEPLTSLGEFQLTAYCSCLNCCGKTDGITATGAKVTEGVTIAVDPNVIPYGTKVVINGNEYTAQDTMAKSIIDKYNGRIIDIYFNNHTDALNFGRQTAEVFVKN